MAWTRKRKSGVKHGLRILPSHQQMSSFESSHTWDGVVQQNMTV